jgi:hypothetical protein
MIEPCDTTLTTSSCLYISAVDGHVLYCVPAHADVAYAQEFW